MRKPRWFYTIPLFCLAVLAQAPPEESGVVIRSNARMVQVSVVVQDKEGRSVNDLNKEDFVLREDGKIRQVAAFTAEAENRPSTPAISLPPNMFSNDPRHRSKAPTSVTAILLDGLNTNWGDQMQAVQHVVEFLKQIQPDDPVAIYGLSRDVRILHDYSSDTAELLGELAAFRGYSPGVLQAAEHRPALDLRTASALSPSNVPRTSVVRGIGDVLKEDVQRAETDYFEELRVRTTLLALEGIANHLAGIPGRKNLIWVSAGFPITMGFLGYDSAEERGRLIPAQVTSRRIGQPLSAEPQHGYQRTFDNEVTRAVRAMNHAGLAIYPVDARGITLESGHRNIGTMQELAERPGGWAYYNTNDLNKSIREAVRDGSVTYTLAYYPGAQKGDNRFHEIKVKVNRPGVTVRHRRGYIDTPGADGKGKDRYAELREAAWSPLEATAVLLKAEVGFSGKPDRGTVRVGIALDPASVTLKHDGDHWAGLINLFLSETDDHDKEYEVLSQTVQLTITETTYRNAGKTGIVFVRTLPKNPKATALRIAIRDAASGNLGSLIIPFRKIA